MTFKGISQQRFFRPAMGSALSVLCGILLLEMPVAHSWVDASYDYLFRFGARSVTNKVVIVQMDDASAQALNTQRLSWDRGLQARLLNKLTDAGAALVVFDVRFEKEKDSKTDQELAAAMRRNGRVVLAANSTDVAKPGAVVGEVLLPYRSFLDAATNWGIGKADESSPVIRRHWPFPAPYEQRPSLPWRAAVLAGAQLPETPQEQWLRYYGEHGGLELLSYKLALSNSPAFFRGKIVFIGNKPGSENVSEREDDKFATPYGYAVGGVEILATEFLNLVNHDWLRRAPVSVEWIVLMILGIFLGAGFCRFRRGFALGIGTAVALLLSFAGICLSYYTNFWFPWLVVVGGQLPCALVWSLVTTKAKAPVPVVELSKPVTRPVIVESPSPKQTIRLSFPEEKLPDAPEYEIITPEIGKGGFGKVWMVRNAIGQWQALKAIYETSFGGHRGPYESEFKGIQRYKPVSEKHPGLLRIDLVSKMKPDGYYYYVMELGDAQSPGWENDPQLYKPRDLENLRKQAPARRLPLAECLRIVTVLADALNFLHQQGLTHRDIKPSNVIFVNGRPKLADVGLVADIRPPEQIVTLVGTPGYMPPPPETPGTPHADIYALGMLLYVISTGNDPGYFPDINTTLMEKSSHPNFSRLNAVILKACQPVLADRYQSTEAMLVDLEKIKMDSPPVS